MLGVTPAFSREYREALRLRADGRRIGAGRRTSVGCLSSHRPLGTCAKVLRIQSRGGDARPRRASSIEPVRVFVTVIDAERGAAIAGEGHREAGEHGRVDHHRRLLAGAQGQGPGGGVAEIVMRGGRVVDVLAPAGLHFASEAGELVDELFVVEEADAAGREEGDCLDINLGAAEFSRGVGVPSLFVLEFL